jgi:hypothetical protein
MLTFGAKATRLFGSGFLCSKRSYAIINFGILLLLSTADAIHKLSLTEMILFQQI